MDARAKMSALARQNYALTRRMKEFEGLIRQRDNVIADLQARLKEAGKVVSFKTAASREDLQSRLQRSWGVRCSVPAGADHLPSPG